MSEMIDAYKALKDHRKAVRAKYGVKCPACAIARPKAPASILIPRQRCRVDGYRDPRPELTDEQWSNA